MVSTKYTVLTPLPPLPLVKYTTLSYTVSPRKLVSLPILSAASPSWVMLKLPSGVGWPGFWALSGWSDGVMICAPAPRITPSGCGLLPLPAFPAVYSTLAPLLSFRIAARPLLPL